MFDSKDVNSELRTGSIPNFPVSCPVCRHGKIDSMPLMDTLACDLCRHIFTFDTVQQSISMADSVAPLTWQWRDRTWQGARRQGAEINWGIGCVGLALIVLPTALIALSTYVFPPIPGSSLYWVPYVWIVLTFLCHFYFMATAIVAYYQIPVRAYLRAIVQYGRVRYLRYVYSRASWGEKGRRQ